MKDYALIAVDMDGTLLDSKKMISHRDRHAIRQAVLSGKTVCIDSGRCIAEVMPTLRELPEIRFVSAMCGAYIYDAAENRVLYERTLPEETVLSIMELTADLDPMFQLMSDQAVIGRKACENLSAYGMEVFRGLFDETARVVEDVPAYYRREKIPVYVVNMYMHSPAERETVKERLLPLGVDVVYGEKTGLACSLPGCDKGTGLSKLCALSGVAVERSIAVGDADNDLPMIRAAGLGVAMGNANEAVKRAAGFVTADNDRSGVAEVIHRYLL